MGNFVHEFVYEFGHPGMSEFMYEKKPPSLEGLFVQVGAQLFLGVKFLMAR